MPDEEKVEKQLDKQNITKKRINVLAASNSSSKTKEARCVTFCDDFDQHGPATSYLRAVLQRRDNTRATSNKMMYETTDSQDLKLKRDNRLVQ